MKLYLLLFAYFTCAQVNAQLTYSSANWNQDSTRIDSANIIVKKLNSSEIQVVLMKETEPDSNYFKTPTPFAAEDIEVFIPVDDKLLTGTDWENFKTQVLEAKIRPHFLLRKELGEDKTIEIYSSKESFAKALKIYQEQRTAYDRSQRIALSNSDLIEDHVSESAAAQYQAKMAKLASEVAAKQAERLRLEEVARKKRNELIKERLGQSPETRQDLINQASQLNLQAQEAYQNKSYGHAISYLQQAIELNPDNDSYYFLLGVSYFRAGDSKNALIHLGLVDDMDDNALERQYFIGLIHYREREFHPAIRELEDVKTAEHPVLSSSAAFYQGMSQFSLEQYAAAKVNFEWVVDHSNDPKLAEVAEEYIEKVAKAIQYKKLQDRKWKVVSKVGTIYDSNILYVSDSDTSTASASDQGGMRLLAHLNAERKFSQKSNSHWAGVWDSYYLYSLKDEFSIIDPWINTFSLPYTRNGTWGKKGVQGSVSLAYESTLMDNNEDGSRERVQDSALFDININIVNKEDWFSTYSVGFRFDDSLLPSSTGDEDADATKLTLRTYQTKLLDQTKKRAFVGSLGFVLNEAKGQNQIYERYEVGLAYSSPIVKWKNSTWTLSLNSYKQDYPSSAENREDFNTALSYSVNRALNDRWSVLGSVVYTNNSSNVSTYQYTKEDFNLTAIYTWVE